MFGLSLETKTHTWSAVASKSAAYECLYCNGRSLLLFMTRPSVVNTAANDDLSVQIKINS